MLYIVHILSEPFQHVIASQESEGDVSGIFAPGCLPAVYVQGFLYQILKTSYTFTKHDPDCDFIEVVLGNVISSSSTDEQFLGDFRLLALLQVVLCMNSICSIHAEICSHQKSPKDPKVFLILIDILIDYSQWLSHVATSAFLLLFLLFLLLLVAVVVVDDVVLVGGGGGGFGAVVVVVFVVTVFDDVAVCFLLLSFFLLLLLFFFFFFSATMI